MIGEGAAIAERLARASIDRGAFERLSDDDLASRVDDPMPGWGATEQVDVDGTRAFVKRVPVTQVELESRGSTANLYGIPTYLNYPYGSPGVGVARELQFALKATQWVENGTCTAFPILLHHRVIERRERFGDPATTGGYTAYRGNEPAMNGLIVIGPTMRADLARYDDVIRFMHEFFAAARSNWSRDTAFDDETLVNLLAAA